jgi:iron complex transport system substrate-binding protein
MAACAVWPVLAQPEVSMNRIRTAVAVLGAVALLALTAGCSSGSTDAATTATTEAVTVEASFPATVTADNGEVVIEQRPQAIVSLSPSLTEILYAIGAGDQVKAVDSSSDHPAGTPMTDLSGFRPNVEALGQLEPDLVLVARDRDGIVGTLQQAGIPVLLLEAPAGLDGIYDQIEVLGAATGHPAEAATVAADIRRDIETAIAALPERDSPPTYFYELSDDYSTTTSGSFIGSVLAAMGLENIADGVDPAAGDFPQLNAEFVLSAEPDYVFVVHSDSSVPTVAEVAARPGWSTLPAVVDGHVVVLDTDIASRWGPRIVELVEAVAAVLGDPAQG